MKTIVALYDEMSHAHQALQELINVGFDRDRISLVAGDREGRHAADLERDVDREIDDDHTITGGAVTGAVVGGLGGLLLGLGALAIPGIGPVVAAGPIVATLLGAGVGAAVGGLVGALVAAGVPEEHAGFYAEGVRRGGTLITVETPEHRVDEVVRILERHHPIDIDERATFWRQEGWTGYDATTSSTNGDSTSLNPDRAHATANGYTATTGMGRGDFIEYDPFFRSHYQTHYADSGFTYAQYETAYHYGYTLATADQHYGRDWETIEPEARQYWNQHYADTPWERFKDAVRYGWQQVKHAVAS